MNTADDDLASYILHPEAQGDVDAIGDYIDQQSGPITATRVVNAIYDTIASLLPLPVRHRGHRRNDLTVRPLLFVSVYDYLIAYAPDEQPMFVIGTLHGKREPRLLAALLRERH